MTKKIKCQICGAEIHSVQLHLKEQGDEAHAGYTLQRYSEEFPDAPVLSETAMAKLSAARQHKAKNAEQQGIKTGAFHEVFELGSAKGARNARGEPIPVTVIKAHEQFQDLVPAKDPNYIFPIDILKDVMMGLELNIPTYLAGHSGTGKTTLLKLTAAHTGRPFLRVQHTVNTEEAHIVGQWAVRDGATVFEPGPLTVAMRYGLVYCADEYDFALPSVLSVYQPVLEGEALVIKEADSENRVVKPHPQFRFVATGNTNGAGDETGLYQGTNIQNAANYERFGIVRQVEYMPAKQEVSVVAGQAGIPKSDAEKLVQFGGDVRKAYEGGKINFPISPRALINSAIIGIRRGDYKHGIRLAYTNRLTSVDRQVVDGYAQRVFG